MFFFQFLDTGDRWREFLANRPLDYIGNRGSGKLNVMGTALLGMAKIVSEDVVHTALKRVDETQSLSWVQGHILASISPALSLPCPPHCCIHTAYEPPLSGMFVHS